MNGGLVFLIGALVGVVGLVWLAVAWFGKRSLLGAGRAVGLGLLLIVWSLVLVATGDHLGVLLVGGVVVGALVVGWLMEARATQPQRRRHLSRQAAAQVVIPVYKEFRDAPHDEPFRLPDDPPHVLRIRSQGPSGMLIWESSVAVAGVTFDNRQANILQFLEGDDQRVSLAHAPFKGHPNAMLVYGHWTKNGKAAQAELGYLPTEVSSAIATSFPDRSRVQATLSTVYLPTGSKSAGLRLTLWAGDDD